MADLIREEWDNFAGEVMRCIYRLALLLRENKAAESKYDPNQPTVPRGNSRGGEWTDNGMSGGGDISRTKPPKPIRKPNLIKPFTRKPHTFHDKPIKPVYPVEEVLAAIYGGRVLSFARTALLWGRIRSGKPDSQSVPEGLTAHGSKRIGQRSITNDEIKKAIRSAKEEGSVSTKLGKYNPSAYLQRSERRHCYSRDRRQDENLTTEEGIVTLLSLAWAESFNLYEEDIKKTPAGISSGCKKNISGISLMRMRNQNEMV